ncbi:MAG: hypothetical protein II921_04820 [Treponema sp.]|nr:hypothetical protein [Treponema sp.]
MENLELIKCGINIVESLTEYMKKDAIGADFFMHYLTSRNEQSKVSLAQEMAIESLLMKTADMESETKNIADNARENSTRLGMISQAIADLKKSVQAIELEQKKYVEEFKSLITQTATITAQINDIQNISAQTNLLSFNASIEAARAGNAGKGFRVIANEVKKLSNDTSKTSEEIKKNVNNLVASISDMEKKTLRNSSALTDLAEETNQTLESFDSVREINSRNNDNVENITQFINSTFEGLNTVIKTIKDSEDESNRTLELFARCASDNEMLFNDFYSFVFQLRAVFKEMSKLA